VQGFPEQRRQRRIAIEVDATGTVSQRKGAAKVSVIAPAPPLTCGSRRPARRAPPLAEAGCRVIAPFLRGFGPTRFLNASTRRTGQPTALACDARQLLDALEMPCVTVVGHDWGARTAYVLAALWPERVQRLITLAVGYETGIKSGAQLNFEQQRHIGINGSLRRSAVARPCEIIGADSAIFCGVPGRRRGALLSRRLRRRRARGRTRTGWS
jgi:pimeloyl-ACP methyl ester carboxylesterase